jgi:iron(III) transport system substrate-binding protein
MAYLRRMMIVPSLVISLALANSTGAQQNSPSTDQAKKDGEVVWYGTLTGGAIVGNILKSFENKYPGIRVKYLRLGGASFVERIRSEARAGRFLWDVVTSEYIQFFELSKYVTLARYAGPDTANIASKHRDPNGTWVSIYGAIATIAWNTKIVKPTEAPKDWKDLLDPRWKGKENRTTRRSISVVRRNDKLPRR